MSNTSLLQLTAVTASMLDAVAHGSDLPLLIVDLSQSPGKQPSQFGPEQDVVLYASDPSAVIERVQVTGGREVTLLGGTVAPSGAKTAASVFFDGVSGSVKIEGTHIDNANAGERDGIAVNAAAGSHPNIIIDHVTVENISGSRTGVHGDMFQSYGAVGSVDISNFYGTTGYQGLFFGSTPGSAPAEVRLENVSLGVVPGVEKYPSLLWLEDSAGASFPVTLTNVSVEQPASEQAETSTVIAFDSHGTAIGSRVGNDITYNRNGIQGSVHVAPAVEGSVNAGEFDLHAALAQALGVTSVQLGTPGSNKMVAGSLSSGLFGGAGDDSLTGSAGADRLDGGLGADLMTGGNGNDVYVVDNVGDRVVESVSGGTDTVLSSVSHTLGPNVENLTLTGSAGLGTGNSLDNTISGNESSNTLAGLAGNDVLNGHGGNDILDGGAGDDVLNGGAGADTMTGGTGNDLYVVDNVGDVVVEWSTFATGGSDTVLSSISYMLGDNVENLSLSGDSALTGTGNKLDNVLIGNAGDNTLVGMAGNDSLDGGAGRDVLTGGSGSDTFIFRRGEADGDQITDFAPGYDHIQLIGYGAAAHADVHGQTLVVYYSGGSEIITIGSAAVRPADLAFIPG